MFGKDCELKFSLCEDLYLFEMVRLCCVIEWIVLNVNWGSKLEDGVGYGFVVYFSFFSYVGMVMKVFVEDGSVKVYEVDCVFDCGMVIVLDSVVVQMEGVVVFGFSMVFYGEIIVQDGVVCQSNFYNYLMLCINEMLKVNVEILQFGKLLSGVGELGVLFVLLVFVNVFYLVIGKCFCDLLIVLQLKV